MKIRSERNIRSLIAAWRIYRLFLPAILALAVPLCLCAGAFAQDAGPRLKRPVAAPASPAAPRASGENDVNDTTVGIVSGTVTGTYIQFASDLSAVLDDPGKLRVLAILGKGSVKNIDDILHVKGVDIGIVQSDVLTYMEKQGLFSGAQAHVQYITKLYNEEFHLLALNDVKRLEDLAGKKVNFGPQGGGMAVTASILFDLLKIKVEPTYDDPALAVEKLKRGEISGAVGVYGKPAKIYSGLKRQDGFHFVPVPYSPALAKVYFPSAFTENDYGDLISADGRVDTVAVGSVMVVYGWQKGSWRYNKVARFVDAFFSRIEEFQRAPRHPKWQEVNLSAPVPGWTRFPPAEEWLKKTAPAAPRDAADLGSSVQPSPETLEAFKQFLTKKDASNPQDEAAKQKLLQQFLEWQNATHRSQ